MTEKIRRFLEERRPETPCLVVDLDVVSENYRALSQALPHADIFYAVKANPAREILSMLMGMGSHFDAASIYEVEHCLDLGVSPDRVSFGNTVKKERDIARAFEQGIQLYAFDSRAELDKLAAAAPGARVFCRIFMDGVGSDWPLSRKFGCEPDMAIELLSEAGEKGLNPIGVSFHVGSQQRDLTQYDVAVGRAATIFSDLGARGIKLEMMNIGGGFPARYRNDIEPVAAYGEAIRAAVVKYFGNRPPRIVAEPGRSIAGDAGILQTEVVLVAEKSRGPGKRWVFLDVGKFGGLPETHEESIQYRITTPHDGGAVGPVVIAGPTCDEVDVLYKEADYQLPMALQAGDKIEFLSTGAYTATYASIGFNGFPPLNEYYI